MSRRKSLAGIDTEVGVETGIGAGGTDAPLAAIKLYRFPALNAAASAANAPIVDFTSFTVALAKALSEVVGQSNQVIASASARPAGELGDDVAWYSTGADWFGIALPVTLAEALVDQRCGGTLTISNGLYGNAASVRGLHAEIVAAILSSASASWYAGGGEWIPAKLPGPSLPLPVIQALTIEIDELSWPLTVALALAPVGTTASPSGSQGYAPEGWADSLRRSLDHVAFPVRVVLFETRLPLAKAAQLRPGDVLPIETPRDVGLRVGLQRLGSGCITPTGDGGHSVTIRASAHSSYTPAIGKAPQ